MPSIATPGRSAGARIGSPVGRAVARDGAAALLPLAVAAGPTWWLIGRPASYPVVVLLLFGTLLGAVVRGLSEAAPGPGIGPANRVTLLRSVLALPVMALALQPVGLGGAAAWWVIVLGTAAMSLDGLDGRVARSTGTTSAFGARFDMEVDAALILALSVLVWSAGHAGAWVLLIGGMRYAFVAAGWIVPALRGELPERLRRKVVCVVQGVVLLVALGPIIPAPLATAVCALGLAALTYSFAVDTVWLLRERRV